MWASEEEPPVARALSTLQVAWFLMALALAPAAYANVRVCQEQDQAYEQIKRGAGPIEINNALFAAADKGCLQLAQRLLDDGASLEARDRLGRMALARAARAGHADIVDLFLARGAPVNARNIDGSTALFLAAEEDNRANRRDAHCARRGPHAPGPQRPDTDRGGGLHGQRVAGTASLGAWRRP